MVKSVFIKPGWLSAGRDFFGSNIKKPQRDHRFFRDLARPPYKFRRAPFDALASAAYEPIARSVRKRIDVCLTFCSPCHMTQENILVSPKISVRLKPGVTISPRLRPTKVGDTVHLGPLTFPVTSLLVSHSGFVFIPLHARQFTASVYVST
jgi:hypothetical protein